jgi:hypothetical protein
MTALLMRASAIIRNGRGQIRDVRQLMFAFWMFAVVICARAMVATAAESVAIFAQSMFAFWMFAVVICAARWSRCPPQDWRCSAS